MLAFINLDTPDSTWKIIVLGNIEAEILANA